MSPKDLSKLIGELLTVEPWRPEALRAVAALDLPDCWIAAGFLRNPVWDRLHGFAAPTPLNDIDVVYFDPIEASEARDGVLEAALKQVQPALPWSVCNQARMHRHNGDRPYSSTEDALRHWLETVSAVAIRFGTGGELETLAPFGFDDVVTLVVRPTPHAREQRLEVYRSRMAKKNWPAIWPRVEVLDVPARLRASVPGRVGGKPRSGA